ncbi:MAG TPA: 4Fe-4S binding protein [Alphaproteobacteria bacterium]|jgi:2-oxoglutarate ferredoxin oxidoreductase subunit delta|nr:4Fe-4S binding protein [Alphaproteobacteria bacterium]MDP7641148.1 4Fe-4S binding protein [Alphaproteobacteria bacterium]HJN61324.1 4Fe-4S binding protein [Alphaproteobacteria bacterium]
MSEPGSARRAPVEALKTYANDKVTLAIREDWCKAEGCEICVEVCAPKSLAIDDRGKAVVVDLDSCSKCLRCEIMCPDFAITLQ